LFANQLMMEMEMYAHTYNS